MLYREQTQILLGAEFCLGALAERWRRNGLYKELGDLFRRLLVYLAIDANHAAKGGDWIRCQGFLVGLKYRGSNGRSAGIAVLDDRHGGLLKLLDQFPGSIQIDQVVVAKFFALKLFSTGDPSARAVRIEGRALVGIFPITQIGRLGVSQ